MEEDSRSSLDVHSIVMLRSLPRPLAFVSKQGTSRYVFAREAKSVNEPRMKIPTELKVGRMVEDTMLVFTTKLLWKDGKISNRNDGNSAFESARKERQLDGRKPGSTYEGDSGGLE